MERTIHSFELDIGIRRTKFTIRLNYFPAYLSAHVFNMKVIPNEVSPVEPRGSRTVIRRVTIGMFHVEEYVVRQVITELWIQPFVYNFHHDNLITK